MLTLDLWIDVQDVWCKVERGDKMNYDTPPEDSDFYSQDDKYCDCCGARYPEDERFIYSEEFGHICYDCNQSLLIQD